MYAFLLILGAVIAAAGVVLIGPGLPFGGRDYDASIVTPGAVAIVGGPDPDRPCACGSCAGAHRKGARRAAIACNRLFKRKSLRLPRSPLPPLPPAFHSRPSRSLSRLRRRSRLWPRPGCCPKTPRWSGFAKNSRPWSGSKTRRSSRMPRCRCHQSHRFVPMRPLLKPIMRSHNRPTAQRRQGSSRGSRFRRDRRAGRSGQKTLKPFRPKKQRPGQEAPAPAAKQPAAQPPLPVEPVLTPEPVQFQFRDPAPEPSLRSARARSTHSGLDPQIRRRRRHGLHALLGRLDKEAQLPQGMLRFGSIAELRHRIEQSA